MNETAPKKSRKWLWIIVGVVVLLIIIGSLGGNDDGTSAGGDSATAEPAAPPVEVTSRQLARDFADNEVAAKAKYDGKVLAVTGTIQSIELDFADDPVVILDGTDEFTSVHAGFDKSEVEQTSTLKKGQKLTVTCSEINEVMGSPMLGDCSF